MGVEHILRMNISHLTRLGLGGSVSCDVSACNLLNLDLLGNLSSELGIFYVGFATNFPHEV